MKIDIEHLLNMAGQDRALAIEVLEIFRTQADTWGRMLTPELDQAQWADAAHALKGSALSIGAAELSSLCAGAEQSGRAEKMSHVASASLLSDLRFCLTQTLDACAVAQHKLESQSFLS